MIETPRAASWSARRSALARPASIALAFCTSLALALVIAFALQTSPRAQNARAGSSWYQDDSKFGFRVKAPLDWDFTAPQPGDPHMIGKYKPAGEAATILVDGSGGRLGMPVYGFLLHFDRRKPSEDEPSAGPIFGKRSKNVLEWAQNELQGEIGGRNWRKRSQKSVKVGGLAAEEWILDGDIAYEAKLLPVRVYAMVYSVEPELEIAYVFNGPGKNSDWAGVERDFRRLATSFERIDLVEAKQPKTKGKASVDSPLRVAKKRALEDAMRRTPGYRLYESPNYFVVTDSDDKAFIEELIERIEAIRTVFERDFPPERARMAMAKRPVKKKKPAPKPEPTGEEPDEDGPAAETPGAEESSPDSGTAEAGEPAASQPAPPEDETVATIDTSAVARTSVVRVVKDQDSYFAYGGPPGSAGYWNSGSQELVVYDDQKGGGRRDTWATLNHEAFHQYIFYFYGMLAPHYWYNEGTGDYYGGAEYNGKKYDIKPFQWRTGTIQQMLNEDRYVPLKEFVRMPRSLYYGNSPYGTDIGDHYAQGWSFVYFLRTGKGRAKGWKPAWDSILSTYLDTLGATGDLDKAVDTAFAGIDWDELERVWKNY